MTKISPEKENLKIWGSFMDFIDYARNIPIINIFTYLAVCGLLQNKPTFYGYLGGCLVAVVLYPIAKMISD